MSRRALVAVACLASAHCAVGPDFRPPPAPLERSYTSEPTRPTASADGKSQRFVEGQPVAGDWWRLFRCAALDDAIEQALKANPGLAAARATLLENQDLLRAGYGVFFPQIDASAGASRQRYNLAPGVLPSSTFNLFTLSGNVSYAIDIWGGKRRQVESLQAGVDAQKYALASATIMLAGNVVNALVAQAAYKAEIDATQGTLALLREQVRIAEAQASAGTVPYSNVLSIQSQLASTAATLPPLEEKIDQAGNLLAALSGMTPASRPQPVVALAELHVPEDVPISLPSQLVRQRPDILIAESQLHAATAGIGVATAAMLPNLTLSAAFGTNGTAPADLFSSNSPFWSFGAGLTQPIFRGGTLYYQRKAAIDARDAAIATYQQTVLAAFEQVADTLRSLTHDADALAAQGEAVETAEKALRLIQVNYQAGIGTYLQMLVADTQYLQAKVGYVQAVAQRMQDTVALYVALGGGWWSSPAVSHT